MMNELKRDWHGRVLPKEVTIIPTKEWGYFIGLVLGDGFIRKNKTRCFSVCIGSTKQELCQIFYTVATTLGLHCFLVNRDCNIKLPSGERRKVRVYEAVIHSQNLYNFLKLYKGADYHFQVPPLVFQTEDALRGFVGGFFDAEGTVDISSHRAAIRIISKHESNLVQIQRCLDALAIRSHIRNGGVKSSLAVADNHSRIRYKEIIGFRLQAKQARLNSMPPLERRRYSRGDYNKVVELRQGGCSYDRIAKETGIAKGTIYNWLQRGKTPREIIIEEYYNATKRETNLGASGCARSFAGS